MNNNYKELREEFKKRTFRDNLKKVLGNECINCGSNKHIHYHHIVPLVGGGTNNIKNIVPLCEDCHGIVHDNKIYKALRKGKELAKLNPNYKDGRPNKFNQEQLEKAVQLKSQGLGLKDIQEQTGVSKSTLYSYIKSKK
ncbi:MAG: HNH endonuclease [Peptostreptococcaceae bacterium]